MTPRLYIAAGALVLLILGGGFLYLKGGADERTERRLEDAESYREGRERIDNATSDDRTPDDVLERLRRHSQQ